MDNRNGDDYPEPDLNEDRSRLRKTVIFVGSFTGLLWLIEVLEAVFGWDLHQLGVYPRELSGLVGVFLAPLIHGGWGHLFANTLPLLVLATALIYAYPKAAKTALAGIYFGSGLGVWLFARESYHIGASGLIHGMMFFVFLMGILRRDRRAIALSLLVFFLYGGMVATILPGEPHISFESHLAGAIMGVILAFALRQRDPPPPRKKYSWEYETEPEEEKVSWEEDWRDR